MFRKIVVFNYYDGPLSGIACDDTEQQVSRFDLLAWDDQEDQRIFCVGQLKDGPLLFREVVDCFSKSQPEHWPVWSPDPVATEDREEWNRISNLLKLQRDYQIVLLADQIYQKPKMVRAIPAGLEKLIHDFIRTGKLQDFETCKALLLGGVS